MPDDYCATCYSDAKKHGRTVRLTQFSKYPVCTLCESRLRNGLIHYRPSNGTEFRYFMDRCDGCRHMIGTEISDPKDKQCAWGILDQLLDQMWGGYDSPKAWFDPANLIVEHAPATCLRFTPRDDPNGEFRDPPRPDVAGQLTFDDVDVPVESPAKEQVKA